MRLQEKKADSTLRHDTYFEQKYGVGNGETYQSRPDPETPKGETKGIKAVTSDTPLFPQCQMM